MQNLQSSWGKNIAVVSAAKRWYKPGPVKDKRVTGITPRWQNQGRDVWRLNKKPGWFSLGTGAQTCCCSGGRLVVKHIPEVSHSSWGGQKLWSEGVRNDVKAAGGAWCSREGTGPFRDHVNYLCSEGLLEREPMLTPPHFVTGLRQHRNGYMQSS